MARHFISLIIVVALGSTSGLFGQNLVTLNITTTDGLPSNVVYHTLQDNDGYLWFATENGIGRYDGGQFQNFQQSDGLSDNCVLRLYQDHIGRIWCLTLSGRICYWLSGNVYNLSNSPLIARFQSKLTSAIYCMLVDNENTMWIGLSNGEVVKVCAGLVSTSETLLPLSSRSSVLEIWQGGDNTVWAFCSNGNIIDLRKNREYLIPAHWPFNGSAFYRSALINDTVFLFRGTQSIGNFCTRTRTYSDVGIAAHIFPGAINYVGEGASIFSTMKGAVILPSRYELTSEARVILPGIKLSHCLMDRDGGIWYSSVGNGVFFTPRNALETYSNLADRPITAVLPNIRAGAYIGLRTGQVLLERNGEIAPIPLQLPPTISPNVYGFTELDNGYIFSASENGYALLDQSGIISNQIRESSQGWKSAIQLHNGQILINMGRYLQLAFFFNGELKLLPPKISHPGVSRYYSIKELSQGQILVGSSQGILEFKNGNLEPFYPRGYRIEGSVVAVEVDAKGAYWVATPGRGIYYLGADTACLLSVASGLSGNNCIDVVLDRYGYTWVGTHSGLNRISRTRNGFLVRQYGLQEGLLSAQINDLSVDSSFLYIGTEKGLYRLRLQEHLLQIAAPKPFIRRLVVNGNTVTPSGSQLELDYTQTNISVQLGALSLASWGRLLYRYRLEGADRQWTTGRESTINYSNLAPGEYKFIAYSINSEGVESYTPIILPFRINLPFWRQWWFYLAIFLGITAFFVVFIFQRLAAANQKAKLAARIAEARHQAMIAQMNPHFIFNALNSVQGAILEGKEKNAVNMLSKFSKLMRKVLLHSKTSTVLLEEEIDMLNLYLSIEQQRLPKRLDYQISVSPELDVKAVEIPALLLQPIVENAIWHGILPKRVKGMVVITISRLDAYRILCVIEDDGIGRDAASQQKQEEKGSMGLALVRERLDLLQNQFCLALEINTIDLFDEFMVASGTKVELILPDVSALYS